MTLDIDRDGKIQAAWDALRGMGVETQALTLITSINGYSLGTLRDVLFAFAGLRDFDQIEGDDDEDA